MSVEDFIDTNIFVYQLERIDTYKAAIAEQLIQDGIANETACISFQVVQECLNTAVRKAEMPITEEEMRTYLESVLAPLLRVLPSVRLYRSSLDVHSRYQFSFYDSLIVASALEAGCIRLYSEDLRHGQQIERLTILNPFLETMPRTS